MIKGIDISGYQTQVDFDILKTNVDFVIVKATEGVGFTDPRFSINQTNLRNKGILRGYYHFARPDLGNTPEAEAAYFLKVIGQPQQGEIFCLDYERNWSGDKVGWCKKFLDSVSNALNGVKPLLYLNQYLITSNDWKPIVDANYGLWVAKYTYDPNNNNFLTGAWSNAVMQQYSDTALVGGVGGVVDADVFFGDITSFAKYGYQPTPVTPPVVVISDPQAKIQIGKIGGTDYGIVELQALASMLLAKDNQMVNLQNEIMGLNVKITDLTDQLTKSQSDLASAKTQINTLLSNKVTDLSAGTLFSLFLSKLFKRG